MRKDYVKELHLFGGRMLFWLGWQRHKAYWIQSGAIQAQPRVLTTHSPSAQQRVKDVNKRGISGIWHGGKQFRGQHKACSLHEQQMYHCTSDIQ